MWGLILQLIFGLFVLRWRTGLMAVNWFTGQVVTFLNYADEGSKFVFGEETYMMHPFAFQVKFTPIEKKSFVLSS